MVSGGVFWWMLEMISHAQSTVYTRPLREEPPS
jgi:hypothetical protein